MATASIAKRESPQRLPARVVRSIDLERQRGEMLVSWIQTLVVALLTTLYLVAPSTAPVDAALRPVPWTLGVYAAFTLYRLYRASSFTWQHSKPKKYPKPAPVNARRYAQGSKFGLTRACGRGDACAQGRKQALGFALGDGDGA